MIPPSTDDAARLAAVRSGLPALAAGVYLNTGSVGPLPAETAAAMAEATEREVRIGRAHPADWEDALERMAEARAGAAAVLGAGLADVALTHSTTDAMNVATWGLDWRTGDRAVTTRHEHAGALGPLYALRDRTGIDVEFADIGDGGDDGRTLAALDRAIRPGTRLVSVSHVLWTTGAVLPVARIAALAHERGAVVAVDGAQAAGALPVDVTALGADVYAMPAQKWLLGPEGVGAAWISPAAADRIRPSFAGVLAFERYDSAGFAGWRVDGRRYETAGFHRPSVLGMARSIGWLAMSVGLDFVHRRGPALARRTADALAALDGVELVTPRERMATLVTFRIRGWTAAAALEELEARVFAIARTIPSIDAVRASVGFFNSEAELDRFVEAVALLAAHRPNTLPPRRRLEVLEGR